MTRDSRAAMLAAAVQFSGAAAWPVPMLAIWCHFASLPWQKTVFKILKIGACVSAILIVLSLWFVVIANAALLPPIAVKEFAAYNAALLLSAGAVMLLGGPVTSRTVRMSS